MTQSGKLGMHFGCMMFGKIAAKECRDLAVIYLNENNVPTHYANKKDKDGKPLKKKL